MSNYKNLSIIIPTINEKENLKSLLFVLKDMYPGVSLFISDDGSSDSTYEFIEKTIKNGFETNLYFLSRDRNEILTNNKTFNQKLFSEDKLKIRNIQGLTASVIDALYLISTEKFIVMDADFQHPPELPGKIYAQLKHSDLVTANRIKLKKFAFHRKLLTKTGNFIANSALPKHARVADPLSGAFGGRINKLKKVLFDDITKFNLNGFKILFDILKIIPPADLPPATDIPLKISTVDYEFNIRTKGSSKIGIKQLLSFLRAIFTKENRQIKLIAGLALLNLFIFIGVFLLHRYGDIEFTAMLRNFAIENPPVEDFFRFITNYVHHFYHLIFFYFLIYGLIGRKKRLLKIAVVFILVQLISSVAITRGLKIIIGRPRPSAAARYGYEHRFFTTCNSFKSFPSGHATDAFASAGVIWGIMPSYFIPFFSFFMSFLVGISRIFVGSHYLLDIIAGMAIGFITGLLVVYKKFR